MLNYCFAAVPLRLSYLHICSTSSQHFINCCLRNKGFTSKLLLLAIFVCVITAHYLINMWTRTQDTIFRVATVAFSYVAPTLYPRVEKLTNSRFVLPWPTLFIPKSGLRPYDGLSETVLHRHCCCYVVSVLDTYICSSTYYCVCITV